MNIEKLVYEVKYENNRESLNELTGIFTKMAYHIANKYAAIVRCSLDVEDYAMLCLMEIPFAVQKFDTQSTGKFSTFVYVAMRNKMLKTVRAFQTQKRNPGNQVYFEDKLGNSEFTYEALIGGGVTFYEECLLSEESEAFLKMSLNESEIKFYKLYLEGLNVSEIAKKTKVSKLKVNKKLKKSKQKVKKSKDIYKKFKN